MKVRIRVLKSR